LANTDIICLAANELNGYLFAGTPDRGIFRSQDDGKNWEAVNSGLTNLNIQTLYNEPEKGHIFAGTPGGGVFRSKDNGDNWVPIHTGSVRVQSRGENNWQSVNTAIPNTVVRSLLTYTTETNRGTGTIESEGNIVRGDGTEFTREFNKGDTITVGNQRKTIADINSDISLQINTPFISNNLNPGSTFVAKTTVRENEETVREIEITGGTISSQGVTVTGNGTDFLPLREGITRITIKANNQTRTVTHIADRNTLTINTPFIRNALDPGTSFTTPMRERNYIFAGTDNGVYRSVDIEKDWIPQGLFDELSDRVIRAFAIDDSYIFAGTDNGVYRSQDEGNNWLIVNNSNLNANTIVYCLITYEREGNNCLLAGTNEGIFYSLNQGNDWTNINNNDLPENITVYALVSYSEHLFAGTNQGIFYSTNNGESWERINQDLTTTDITSLAVKNNNNNNNNHQLFAGSLFSGFRESDWSGFELTEPEIDLNTIYPKILEDSWIVLLDENLEKDETYFQAFQVNKLSTVSRSNFTLTSEVTRIFPSKSVNLSDFRRRDTQVLVQSEPLTLAPELLTVTMQQEKIFLDPINQNKVYLNKFISNLESNKTLIVSGKHIRAIAENIGGFFVWNSDESKWERNNQGLTNTSVQALVIDGEFTQYIGTVQGVFRLRNGDKTWKPLKNEALEDTNIQSLLISSQTKAIFAATPSGIYKYSNNNWQAVNQGLAHVNVQTLVSYQDGETETISIFAGTVDGGV
ncbi:MAG: hypothetical protein SWZ49_29920, partial [Cyanobacteriota bacterium]|nr:hypothetical protein [Cyanobacteriota bacterium]